MNIKEAIEIIIKNKIINSIDSYKKITGGTTSEIWQVETTNNDKLVIKFNEKDVIKYESLFLNKYMDIDLFPKVKYIDSLHRFFLYEYIDGEVNCNEFNAELLYKLINVVKSYKVYKEEGYGWIDDLSTWDGFLGERVEEARRIMEDSNININYDSMEKLIDKISGYKFEKYLLHGDFGVHNFIFENRKLKGVIDPTPVIGDRIYDVLYGICSKPQFINALDKKILYKELCRLGYDEESISCYFKIILYTRIGTCIKYHKEDLKSYLNIWEQFLGSK